MNIWAIKCLTCQTSGDDIKKEDYWISKSCFLGCHSGHDVESISINCNIMLAYSLINICSLLCVLRMILIEKMILLKFSYDVFCVKFIYQLEFYVIKAQIIVKIPKCQLQSVMM